MSHVPLSELLLKGRYGEKYPTIIIFIIDIRRMTFANELDYSEILSITLSYIYPVKMGISMIRFESRH